MIYHVPLQKGTRFHCLFVGYITYKIEVFYNHQFASKLTSLSALTEAQNKRGLCCRFELWNKQFYAWGLMIQKTKYEWKCLYFLEMLYLVASLVIEL